MDTDQLEHDLNQLCHQWMQGKATTEGVFGTVQATARVFHLPGALGLDGAEETGQTEPLAPDFRAWLHTILEGEEPHVRRVSSVKVSIPKH